MILRQGKADELVLDRSVRKRLGKQYEYRKAAASDPVTLRTSHIGMLAVAAAVNDLAAGGIRAAGIRTDILLPSGTDETDLRRIEDEIAAAAQQAEVVVTGGHTEVTSAVVRPVVIAHAVGTDAIFPEQHPLPEPGNVILAIGQTGLEGTFLLEEERWPELRERFSSRFLRWAQETGDHLLITPALEVLAQTGIYPVCLVNVSEGGILAALWHLSQETGTGLTVELSSVPIRQETVEITNYYDINPYRMESAGCVLAVISCGAEVLCKQMEERGFCAKQIGVLTAGREKTIVIGEERQSLNRPAPDSLLPLLG